MVENDDRDCMNFMFGIFEKDNIYYFQSLSINKTDLSFYSLHLIKNRFSLQNKELIQILPPNLNRSKKDKWHMDLVRVKELIDKISKFRFKHYDYFFISSFWILFRSLSLLYFVYISQREIQMKLKKDKSVIYTLNSQMDCFKVKS